MIRPLAIVPVVFAIALLTGCGGGSSTPGGAATPAPSVSPASPAVSATPAAPSPTATATTRPRTAADDALAAAVAKYNAVVHAPGVPCAKDNPKNQACIDRAANVPSTPDRGVAAFGVSDAGGFGGFIAIFGRTQAGTWDFWFGTQNTSYHVFALPAPMLVCADGDGVNVRKAPGGDAAIVTLLKDLTRVQAEEFILAVPGAGAEKPGTGWYRISTPAEGWVHSSFVSDAQLNDCSLRDSFEKKH